MAEKTRAKFPLDEETIRRLATILAETGLSEIEVEADDQRIRIARRAATVEMAAPMAASPQQPAASGEASGKLATSANAIVSPMVGTVYLAAEPGAPAFVSLGDRVKAGDTLLIIEAMMVMNRLEAPATGTVTAILVEDGQPVEFGEPLLVVE